MFKAYRYEMKTNDGFMGPYRAWRFVNDDDKSDLLCTLSTKLGDKHGGADHPSIWEDCPNFGSGGVCACPTIEDLKAWFKGFNTEILRHGFNLVEYTVKEYTLGKSGYQCGISNVHIKSRKIIK